MPIAKVELTGGAFQDSEGNVLANGYLIMKLSQDSVVNTSQVCSGIEIKIDLGANGDVAVYPSHTVQSVWGNDQLAPANSFYRVTGYKASGQPAWGPNNQQVIGDGGTFDVGTWVPNQVISWTPPLQSPLIEVNGVPLISQQAVDFEDSDSVAFSNPSAGIITATAGGGSGALPNSSRILAHYPAALSASQVLDTNIGDAQLTNSNGAGITLTISTKAPTTSFGPSWNLHGTGAGTSSGFSCSFPASATQYIFGGRDFVFQSAGAILHTDSSGRAWIGVGDAPDGYNTGATRPTSKSFAAFIYEPATSSNWIVVVCDGSSITSFTTSVVADSTPHTFEIDFTTGVSAVFKIDDTVIATLSTNLPSPTATMAPFFMINPYVVAEISLDCAYLYASQPIL